MRANDVKSAEPLRHGAYVCLRVPEGARRAVIAAAVPALAEGLGLQNEFEAKDGPPADAIAFLRRVGGSPADIVDEGLLRADAVVHVASARAAPVTEFCAEVTYTGNAMHNFAYAHRVLQQAGSIMPNAFLVPLSKTAAWWAKDWMERHTYFLPRYEDGRMVNEGHALASAAGIACLMRRTYKHETEPAPAGRYDFVTYFECADADIPTFHDVCAALRDVTKNPEWAFVREGPTWHGRRVAAWAELFA